MKYKPGDPVKVKDWEQLNKRPFFEDRFGQPQSNNGIAVLEGSLRNVRRLVSEEGEHASGT
jgi:hypothetical protein